MLKVDGEKFHYEDNDVSVILDSESLNAEKVTFKNDDCNSKELISIAQFVVLYKNVRPTTPFADLEMEVR